MYLSYQIFYSRQIILYYLPFIKKINQKYLYLIHLLNMQYENVTIQTHTCCRLQPVDRIILSHQYMTLFTWCCVHIHAYKNCTINLTFFISWPCKSPDLYFKKPLFALKYTLKHSLIKNRLISTPTCFGPIRPSSGSCRA